MALFKKSEPVQVVEPVVEEVKVEEKKPASFQPVHTTYIGKGITFIGDFVADDPVEVKGRIEGDINASKLVTIFEEGSYEGTAKVANIDIKGDVKGNVQCGGLTAFSPSGKMEGNLKTSELRTDVGTSFVGNLIIDHKNPVEAQPVQPVEEAPVEAPAEEKVDLTEEGDVAVTEADIFG